MRSIELHCLAVGRFEANAVVDEVVHNKMILLLNVAEDAEPVAARHSQASGACLVIEAIEAFACGPASQVLFL